MNSISIRNFISKIPFSDGAFHSNLSRQRFDSNFLCIAKLLLRRDQNGLRGFTFNLNSTNSKTFDASENICVNEAPSFIVMFVCTKYCTAFESHDERMKRSKYFSCEFA